MKTKQQREPFSIEIKIKDEKGHKIFHWHETQNNLILGMKETGEFVTCKLGIDNKDVEAYWLRQKKAQKQIDTIVEQNLGGKK